MTNRKDLKGTVGDLYTMTEAAAKLGVSPPTVDELVKKGLLEKLRAFGRVLFDRKTVDSLAETRRKA